MSKLHNSQSVFRHICQLSADKGILFYSTADFLVFYTTISSKCLREGVVVIAFSIMFNHFHLESMFETDSEMASFVNGAVSPFAKRYNSHYGLSGQVFRHNYNRSKKFGEKHTRDIVVYIGNNGKEKIPGIKAEDYRWNFLKYLVSTHPFSEEIDYRTASPSLIRLMSIVIAKRSKLQSLNYDFFESEEYCHLSEKEKKQLTDFIITTYFFLDKDLIFKLYGSYENLCTAINAVSGAEHSFADDFSSEDYRHYYRMIRICIEHGFDVTKHRYSLPGWHYDHDRKAIFWQDEGISAASCGELSQDAPVLPSSCGNSSQDHGKYPPSCGGKEISKREFSSLIAEFQTEMNVSDYEIAKFFHLLSEK